MITDETVEPEAGIVYRFNELLENEEFEAAGARAITPLVLDRPADLVREIIDLEVMSVTASIDHEEGARMFARYDLRYPLAANVDPCQRTQHPVPKTQHLGVSPHTPIQFPQGGPS